MKTLLAVLRMEPSIIILTFEDVPEVLRQPPRIVKGLTVRLWAGIGNAMEERRIWLVANWKMHGSRSRAASYSYRVNQALSHAPAGLQAVFCPPAILLESAQHGLPQNTRLKLGGQNMHASMEGAFTGECSARMLREAGATYVILGHSERRAQCYETCEDVLAKAKSAIEEGLRPILCVGETLAEREAGQTADVLARQLAHFTGLDTAQYLIAYEPVWAIGSGKTPTLDEIATAHAQVKSTLGSAVGVLYGGSVKSTNLSEILSCKGVDGALIGGASLEAESMIAMVKAASAVIKG